MINVHHSQNKALIKVQDHVLFINLPVSRKLITAFYLADREPCIAVIVMACNSFCFAAGHQVQRLSPKSHTLILAERKTSGLDGELIMRLHMRTCIAFAGIKEPVGGGAEAGVRLGLGKQEQDQFYTTADNIQRKRLETEIQANEDDSRAALREVGTYLSGSETTLNVLLLP